MVYNFNSGPSILPQEVLVEAASAIHDFSGTGLSILEIGHRTKTFEGVVEESVSLVRELMGLDADKEVLFLHGGATTQFFQVPMNLLDEKGMAAYLDCGIWGSKAIKEARLFGDVQVVASSADRNHRYIPTGYTVPESASYLHLTSNNTVEGTQMREFPETGVPLVADMSSDILSRGLDFNRFSLIYAGAQKNIGVAGVTMVVVDRHMLGRVARKLPAMMDYRNHIENGSMLNTPPVFAVYVCLLTLRWLKRQGGVAAVEKSNRRKAALLYEALDSSSVFVPTVDKADRSDMNVVFVTREPRQEQEFLELCRREGIVGVKGHRSVGGLRASLYNAMAESHVAHLIDLMRHFEKGC
jgi:phosphoserine aminotransferase